MHEDILDYNYEDDYQEPSYQYAGFWIRVGASLVDVLVFIPLAVINVYNSISIKSLPLEILIIIVYLGYKPFMEYNYGATLGKMAVKIRVIDVLGAPIDALQAIVRNIPYLLAGAMSMLTTLAIHFRANFNEVDTLNEYNRLTQEMGYPILSALINIFFFTSCIFVAFRENRQALHDSMAQTYCIYD